MTEKKKKTVAEKRVDELEEVINKIHLLTLEGNNQISLAGQLRYELKSDGTLPKSSEIEAEFNERIDDATQRALGIFDEIIEIVENIYYA